MNVYEIDFKVDLTTKKEKWTQPASYSGVQIAAEDLDEVINQWPRELLEMYPFVQGTGGSHYGQDPISGDKVIFLMIREIASNIKTRSNK